MIPELYDISFPTHISKGEISCVPLVKIKVYANSLHS